MSTIQYDFNQPAGFGLEYQAADGTRQQPVMIHSAKFGSIERFIGVLVEHYAGAFPPWLSPVQVIGIPVADEYDDYLARRRRPARARPAYGSRSTPPTTGCRRRSATPQKAKVPVHADRRRRRRRPPVRSRSATATAPRSNGVPVAEAIAEITDAIADRVQV